MAATTEYQDLDVVSLLAELVAIPSPSGQEHQCQAFITEWFTQRGLIPQLQSAADGLQNLILEVNGKGPGKTLFLGGHCDTVAAGAGWVTHPTQPKHNGNRLYGLGAMDMKAGLAAAMVATVALARVADQWSGQLLFASLCDEELNSRGASSFVEKFAAIDAAIMCEPHFERVGIGAIGKVNIVVDVTGKSAHASRPQQGVNAITEAARFLCAFEQINRFRHPDFGTASHCVINARSGDGSYQIKVPEAFQILINWHFMPGETPQDAVKVINQMATDLNSAAQFSVTVKDPVYDSFHVPEDTPFIRQLIETIAVTVGEAPSIEFCQGVSDANIFSGRAGIPTVLFGPSGSGMHAANEWADITQLKQSAMIYRDFALRFFSQA